MSRSPIGKETDLGNRTGSRVQYTVMLSQADVARKAGVSIMTVSRVINGAENVRPETREKVLEAIRELAYYPNAAARALTTVS